MVLITSEEAISYVEGLDLQEGTIPYDVISMLSLLGQTTFVRAVSALYRDLVTFQQIMNLPEINESNVNAVIDAADSGPATAAANLRALLASNSIPGFDFGFAKDVLAPFSTYITARMRGRQLYIVDPFSGGFFAGSYQRAETAVRARLAAGMATGTLGTLATTFVGLFDGLHGSAACIPAAVHAELMRMTTDPVFMDRAYADHAPLDPDHPIGAVVRGLHTVAMCPPSEITVLVNDVISVEVTARPDGSGEGALAIASIADMATIVPGSGFLRSYHRRALSRFILPGFYEESTALNVTGLPVVADEIEAWASVLAYMNAAAEIAAEAIALTTSVVEEGA
jgi:hypothetical protein